ncbi:MAG TPA: N-acetyltransferase family protein [Candidatus Obscuribacterales bacterium]
MNIRDAVEADLAAIVNIYNASIPNRLATADTEPVSVESRLAWYKQHTSTSRPLWVMEIDSSVVGWLSFRSFYGRPAYHTTAEISIYVSPNYHRQGVAQQLLEKAICESPTLGLKTLVGFIFAHNEPSLQLFTKYDFERWGYLPKIAELDGIERDLVILGRRVEEKNAISHL